MNSAHKMPTDLDDIDLDELWSSFKAKVKDFAITNPEIKVDHIFILSDDNVCKMLDAIGLDCSHRIWQTWHKIWKIWLGMDRDVPHKSLGWMMNSENW